MNNIHEIDEPTQKKERTKPHHAYITEKQNTF
jgi:hypothetical protein